VNPNLQGWIQSAVMIIALLLAVLHIDQRLNSIDKRIDDLGKHLDARINQPLSREDTV
jgi:hypothetical protein